MRAWPEADAAHDINDVAAADDLARAAPVVLGGPYPFRETGQFGGDGDTRARGADVRHRPLGTAHAVHLAASGVDRAVRCGSGGWT